MITAIIIAMVIFIVVCIISTIYVEPSIYITLFHITPKTFRLHKPKDSSHYFLQVRVLWVYYFIYKSTNNDYMLYLAYDNFSLYYEDHYILSSDCKEIYRDRYNIIKYFSDNTKPIDNINL